VISEVIYYTGCTIHGLYSDRDHEAPRRDLDRKVYRDQKGMYVFLNSMNLDLLGARLTSLLSVTPIVFVDGGKPFKDHGPLRQRMDSTESVSDRVRSS
jgi:hypothetical protein